MAACHAMAGPSALHCSGKDAPLRGEPPFKKPHQASSLDVSWAWIEHGALPASVTMMAARTSDDTIRSGKRCQIACRNVDLPHIISACQASTVEISVEEVSPTLRSLSQGVSVRGREWKTTADRGCELDLPVSRCANLT